MKVTSLLPLPLLFVPFSQAAEYLVRFKEGIVVTSTGPIASNNPSISRLENFQNIHTAGQKGAKFDYSSKELSLTVLSLSQATAIAHGGSYHPHRHGKSKAQIEAMKAFGDDTEGASAAANAEAIEIKSKGRWFTFDDSEFHVWHGDFTEEEAALLANDAGVAIMERDLVIRFAELEKYNNSVEHEQLSEAYDRGLPRVSQRTLPLRADYNYPNQAGEGVDVYVIDTGININHIDFEGRAKWGVTTVPGAPNTDDNGHGTFVAGVIGSRTFGVAKKVSLIAVKGLNREGTSTLSQILAALDWVIKQNAQSSNHKNVVNLSLGAGYSKVLNSAVDTLVQSGMFIVAAAGNGNDHNIGQNACNYSPASTPTAFTVGSTNINDQMSSFSNYGQCVNIYAPGERVRSTWIGPTNREIFTDSGTSFSAPNVAGIAALIMSAERGDRSDGSWSPKNVGNRILQLGTRNVVKNFKGPANTNLLAFNGAGILGINNGSGGNGGTNGGTNGGNAGNEDGGEDGGGDNGGGDSGSRVPPFGGDPSSPRNVNGPSVSSTTNHVPTLTALQTLTILSTVGSTLVFLVASL
ncbi:serine protease [Haplosporangium bisporale]|nr:serine protease [Haplosporangium bisporale]